MNQLQAFEHREIFAEVGAIVAGFRGDFAEFPAAGGNGFENGKVTARVAKFAAQQKLNFLKFSPLCAGRERSTTRAGAI